MKRSLKSTVQRTGSEPLAKLFGGKAGKKPADYVCAITNGLAPPKMELLGGKGSPKTTRSNPVKPSEEV